MIQEFIERSFFFFLNPHKCILVPFRGSAGLTPPFSQHPCWGGALGFKYAATFMVRALQNLELVVIPVSSRALCSNLSSPPLSKNTPPKKTITSHSRSQSLDITEQDSGSRGKEARRKAACPRTRPARRPVSSCCADASKKKRKEKRQILSSSLSAR